jgi:SAM-dependent methyltransferase
VNDYLLSNRAQWDDRAPVHARSREYDVARLVGDPQAISDVVAFDRPRLGDLSGIRGIHLQCHIGTDTLSLVRLGAQMTGLDFSSVSLEQAREITARAGTPVEFVQAEVYGALEVLPAGSFDLVYTGIGAICWLPDIDRWAQVVAALLAPGGRLFVRDLHPMLGTIDVVDGALVFEHPYYYRPEAMVFEGAQTYVETDESLSTMTTYEWAHGLGEIVTALLAARMEITELVEHESVPWNALPGLMSKDEHGEWRLTDRPERLGASFTLQARCRLPSGTG